MRILGHEGFNSGRAEEGPTCASYRVRGGPLIHGMISPCDKWWPEVTPPPDS